MPAWKLDRVAFKWVYFNLKSYIVYVMGNILWLFSMEIIKCRVGSWTWSHTHFSSFFLSSLTCTLNCPYHQLRRLVVLCTKDAKYHCMLRTLEWGTWVIVGIHFFKILLCLKYKEIHGYIKKILNVSIYITRKERKW